MVCDCGRRPCGNVIDESRTADVAGRPRTTKKRKPTAVSLRWLSIRHETTVSTFRQSVPFPAYRLPKQPFSRWRRTDLGDKLPALRRRGAEEGGPPPVFHNGQMGSNPWHVPPDRDEDGRPRFSLDDPYCRDVSYAYNPLHDPHLKGWLTSSGVCQHLYRQGLITEDLDVVCGLKEHNEYRRFLGRRHDDAIAAAARHKNARDVEYGKIVMAIANHKKSLEKKSRLLLDKTGKRVTKAVEKKRPKPKRRKVTWKQPEREIIKRKPPEREIVTKRPTKRPVFDIDEIKTYSEFGRRADGQIDYTNYLGTFIEGCFDDYHMFPNAKRFFKQPAEVAKTEDEFDSLLVGIDSRPFKCDLAIQAAENASLIEHSVEKLEEFPVISPSERFNILVDSMKL